MSPLLSALRVGVARQQILSDLALSHIVSSHGGNQVRGEQTSQGPSRPKAVARLPAWKPNEDVADWRGPRAGAASAKGARHVRPPGVHQEGKPAVPCVSFFFLFLSFSVPARGCRCRCRSAPADDVSRVPGMAAGRPNRLRKRSAESRARNAGRAGKTCPRTKTASMAHPTNRWPWRSGRSCSLSSSPSPLLGSSSPAVRCGVTRAGGRTSTHTSRRFR